LVTYSTLHKLKSSPPNQLSSAYNFCPGLTFASNSPHPTTPLVQSIKIRYYFAAAEFPRARKNAIACPYSPTESSRVESQRRSRDYLANLKMAVRRNACTPAESTRAMKLAESKFDSMCFTFVSRVPVTGRDGFHCVDECI